MNGDSLPRVTGDIPSRVTGDSLPAIGPPPHGPHIPTISLDRTSSWPINEENAGWVFNIQRYSLHDGAGIRTLVFLKGCPLRCDWCSNPESQRLTPDIAFDGKKCLGRAACGFCSDSCPDHSLDFGPDGRVQLADKGCPAYGGGNHPPRVNEPCQRCAAACPTHALHAFGNRMTTDQVMDIVESDSLFYARSQGGVTLSGGEPLMQGRFALSLLKEAKKRHINTLVETCGHGAWPVLAALAGYCDGLYFDVKSLDDVKHRQFTRRSNRRILDNLRRLRQAFPRLPIHVRTPLIPGFNHNQSEIDSILDFILPLDVTYEILPYHRLGSDKYRLLGRDYPLGEARLTAEDIDRATSLARRRCGPRYGPPA
jgi:pyruvate formate lyase activating enzyme